MKFLQKMEIFSDVMQCIEIIFFFILYLEYQVIKNACKSCQSQFIIIIIIISDVNKKLNLIQRYFLIFYFFRVKIELARTFLISTYLLAMTFKKVHASLEKLKRHKQQRSLSLFTPTATSISGLRPYDTMVFLYLLSA